VIFVPFVVAKTFSFTEFETMRAFLAAELDESIRSGIGRFQDRLRAAGADVKWVAADKLHLTLKFLGEIEASWVEDVCRFMAEAAAGMSPFSFEVNGAGAFPPRGIPRVVWVGVQDPGDRLGRLFRPLDQSLTALGIAREKRAFHPHITVGRVRRPKKASALSERLRAEGDVVFGTQQVDQIVLFESRLSSAGPTYSVVHAEPLRTGRAE